MPRSPVRGNEKGWESIPFSFSENRIYCKRSTQVLVISGRSVTDMRKLETLSKPTPQQVTAWRAMSPARRLELAFQAYQFALDAVRLTERKRHPNLSPSELAWRITRRMQGDSKLGR
jgi:hypothetical protein